jgi:hypothetical protein
VSPDEGEVLSGLPDEGEALSSGALDGGGALVVSTTLDEGASDGGLLSEVVVVSDIQAYRSRFDQERRMAFCCACVQLGRKDTHMTELRQLLWAILVAVVVLVLLSTAAQPLYCL